LTGVTDKSLYPGFPTWKKSPVVSQFGLLSHCQSAAPKIFSVLNLHEEVAEAPLVRASSADFVIEVRSKRNAGTTWRNDVNAVALEAAIVAQVDGSVGTLLDVRDGSGEGDAGC
jgi:hypothetical protein